MLKVGGKAPAFRLKNDAGNEVSLSDYLGKRVVLFFYPKANTPG
jgi:thioredoxin-dependent peroxiredoxin